MCTLVPGKYYITPVCAYAAGKWLYLGKSRTLQDVFEHDNCDMAGGNYGLRRFPVSVDYKWKEYKGPRKGVYHLHIVEYKRNDGEPYISTYVMDGASKNWDGKLLATKRIEWTEGDKS